MRNSRTKSAAILAGALAWEMGRLALRSSRRYRFPEKPVVLITGGSRGLGLALAMDYIQRGARLAICSRDLLELRIAEKKLLHKASTVSPDLPPDIMIQPCDITDRAQVQDFIAAVISRFGKIDVLVNNAGIMEVAPLEDLDEDDFKAVIDANLWGTIRLTLGSLPHMPSGARIVNITSIGAAVAIPHLLPYTVSKFGALGFSLGIDAELRKRKISVTTVLPGLMRTGSFVNALFKGNREREFSWFALGASLPFTSVSAESAARAIVKASRFRKHFLVISPQAKILRLFSQLAPEPFLALMGLMNRLLPQATGTPGQKPETGRLHRAHLPHGGITRLGDSAGDRLNENIV